ncbi:two-component system response regulator LytT [Flavobacterium sp. PL11]|jgi:two-component system response regulator LytT|uniref:LytR/AlgR family response regulator transcription factor n=1 Tax=Flavobacterium sp. PL11 TaxID=3071717 RepID=UPI002DFC2D13|nr:two-component system response regulator LytT [Flavobacterium sp. PL11]
MVNILIVEDELIIAQDIAITLKNAGYNVVAMVMDYGEGIEAIKNNKIDLILLDINLKGVKSGLDLARTINEDYAIPFIFITSYTDSDTINEAKKLKPTNYLVKPFQKEQLLTAIKIADFKIQNEDEANNEGEDQVFFIKNDIFIKDKLKYTRINLDEVLYIKSERNYLELYTENEKPIVVRSSIQSFCEKINQSQFIQTHRSYVINFDHLTDLEMPFVTVKKTKIPISRKYMDVLLKKFRIL